MSINNSLEDDTFLNISTICRICCAESARLSIFKANIHKKIMSCSSVQIWVNDGLPSKICNKCAAILNLSYQFKKQCEQTDKHLQECKRKGIFTDSSLNQNQEGFIDKSLSNTDLQETESPITTMLNDFCANNVPDLSESNHENNEFEPNVPLSISTQEANIDPHFLCNNDNDSLISPISAISGSIYISNLLNINSSLYNLQDEDSEPVLIPVEAIISDEPTMLNQDSTNNEINLEDSEFLTDQDQIIDDVPMEDSVLLNERNRNHIDGSPLMDNETYFENQINEVLFESQFGQSALLNNNNDIDKTGNQHMQVINLEDKHITAHKCNVCGKEFISNWKLNRHLKTHSLEAPYKCKKCQKGFTSAGNLKVHTRIHTNERPFVCQFCNKSFRYLQDLEKHVRTHTGERPHVCSMCNRGFTTSSNLIAHERIHTGEKPYVCSLCTKAFCQSSELTKHMRTHTGEKSHICTICSKGFNGASTLTVHMRIHTGERPFVCNICNKGFTQSSCLAAHARRHTGLEGFSCQRCPRSFMTIEELTIHETTHPQAYLTCPIPDCT